MLTLNYEYRIYPNAQQEQQMLDWLEQCRQVWNYALAERRDWIRSRSCRIDACSLRQEYIIPADAPKPTYHYQQAQLTEARAKYPELAAVHSQVLQCVLRQLEQAFVSMWERGFGFPRFKKFGRMRSFVFPQFAKSPIVNDGEAATCGLLCNSSPIGGQFLKLPKFDGAVRVNLHRPSPDGFIVKQVRIVKRASGWYAMLSLQASVDVPSIIPGGYPIGIDVGLDSFVATSEGELVVRPRFFVESQHKLKLLNRDVSRKQKGSKNQQKARKIVARFYERINNRRKDFHFKVAHHLCDNAGMIFAEELNLLALAKGMLGKHCLDAGWGQFLTILGYIAWKRGVYFGKVPATGTSQTCPQCDASVPKDLSVRVHHCLECGYQTNRDVASSQVIRNRGLVAVGHIAQACGAEPVGVALKQEIRQVIVGSPRRTC